MTDPGAAALPPSAAPSAGADPVAGAPVHAGRIRLRHLQCVLAVARTGGLGRAAEQLAITQPAVTRTIAELEDILGVRLFERGRHGARPTHEGQAFLRHAAESVAALGLAVDALRRDRDERPIRIGALPTVAPSFVPDLLRAFRAECPRVSVRVTTDRNARLLRALRDGELDLAIGRIAEPDEMAGLAFESLWAEPMVAIVRPGHPLLAQSEPLDRLGQFELLLPLPGTIIRHAAEGFLAGHGIVPVAGTTETLSSSLARGLLCDGDAVWLTPLGSVEPDLDDGRLVRLPVGAAGAAEPMGLLQRIGPPATATLQLLAATVRARAALRRERLGRTAGADAAG